ncbi:MAG TPA: hypothetical protein LFW20_03460 [Rickettsia endosymbiont of Omalisus fontisbellaquei]|nr:hypothetical protein [Rickettsia endosymbiont of Omalisus fontisbellaquei]
MNKIKLIIVYLFCINLTAQADNISEIAKKNLEVINSLNVEEKWQKGNIINCKSGETLLKETEKYNSPKLKRLTHCSCFAYAASAAFGLPNKSLLPHPESDKEFIPTLSNKQAEWLETDGIKNGWNYVKAGNRDDSFIQAQKFANQGYFVVSVYKNANPKRAGHIAVVVPSSKDIEKIKNEGPDTAQAGNINFSCNSLKKGFRNKKDAFKNNEIKFYYYKI